MKLNLTFFAILVIAFLGILVRSSVPVNEGVNIEIPDPEKEANYIDYVRVPVFGKLTKGQKIAVTKKKQTE